jgi:hypothetical protein
MSKIKSAQYINEPVFVNKDGSLEPYVPKTIVTHRAAYAASLDVLLKHCADMHILTLTVLSEKYGIPVDDMVQTVMEDDGYKNMLVNPKIHALSSFDEKDLAKVIPPAPADPVEEVTKKMEEVTLEPKPKKRIPKKKPAAAEGGS